MSNGEEFRGEYVLAMDRLPTSRFRWLVPKLGLKPSDAVVDYACGSGRLLDCIHEQVAHYHGVDFSQDFITYASERIGRLGITNASFECAEIIEFCARNRDRFDVATTIDFAGYLDDAAFVRIYSAIRDSLRSGGRLFTYMANGGYALEILKRRGLAPRTKAPYGNVRTGEEYRRLLLEAGFRELEVSFTPHYNALRHLHFLSHLPGLGRFMQAKVLVAAVK